jgi:Uncharacterized protein conserved in bacteria (DUF2257).
MRQLSLLDEVKKAYQEHRSAFIPGTTMQAILLALGARPEDFAKLQQVSANLADDPTLPFRKSRNGRFCFDFDRAQIERLEFQPFVLSVEEDFIRYDSGKVRHFRGINDDLQLNTAFQALMKFKAYVIDGVNVTPRPGLIRRSTSSFAPCSTCAPSPHRRCWANRRWKACTATASTTP